MADGDLVRAGLESDYDLWSNVRFGVGVASIVIGAILAVIACFAQFQIEYWLPKEAARRNGADEERLSRQSPAAWPVWLLKKRGWLEVQSETAWTESNHISLFYKKERNSNKQLTADVIMKREDQTIAMARLYAMGEGIYWAFDRSDKFVDYGAEKTTVDEVVKNSGLLNFVSEYKSFPIAIVGVGLESSYGGDPKDQYRELSDDRAVRIITAANKALNEPDDSKIEFRAVGLGRNIDKDVAKDSLEERRQRSVVMLVLAQMNNDVILSSVEDAILTISINSRSYVDFVDLSEYEYSFAADERLSPSLGWGAKSSGPDHQVPKIDVSEAMKRRPQKNKSD